MIAITKRYPDKVAALVSFSYNVGNPSFIMESADKGDMESVRKK